MEGKEGQSHYVKRVVLPSGKTIEVVYFKDVAEAGGAGAPSPAETASPSPAETASPEQPSAPAHPPAEPHQELHRCVGCASELVHPVHWEEAGPQNWTVLLHCPNCDVYREGVFSQATVEAFDEELDRGSDILARDYRSLTRANMSDEIERFVAALEADAILPSDF